MIIRTLLVVNLLIFQSATSLEIHNARSYDTNDWIPITSSSKEKRATGRVLNLDAPAQKFFPDERNKRPQYLREVPHQKNRFKVAPNPYHFERQPPMQYFTNKEVKLQTFERPPPLVQPQYPFLLNQQEVPPPNAPNLYEQYNNFNNSLHPLNINQELLGAIENIENIQALPLVQTSTTPKAPEENVQLLYVPLENLKSNQLLGEGSQTVYQRAEPPRNQEKQFYSAETYNNPRLAANVEQDFLQQALQAHKLQEQIQLGQPIAYSTTPKPKKRKPHQPPLAVYMEGSEKSEVSDVLDVLKNAKTISVQDTIQSNSPQIFIGPSTLDPPEGYSKFPLPYLNSLEGNRVERKIDQLPFFVAPLSYKTPQGYSKIPLPSPHVGSVVVSNRNNEKQYPSNAFSPLNINQYTFDHSKTFGQQVYEPRPTTTDNLIPQFNNYNNNNKYVEPTYQGQFEVNQQQSRPQNFFDFNQPTQDVPPPVSYSPKPQQQIRQEFSNIPTYSKPIQDFSSAKPTQNTQDYNSFTKAPQDFGSTPYSKPSQQPYVNPLELAINEFELHQINSQLDDSKASPTPPTPTNQQIDDFINQYQEQDYAPRSSPQPIIEQTTTTTTTTTTTPKPRQRRIKPTRQSAIRQPSTTSSYENSPYTVLEEFTAKSVVSPTAQYSSEYLEPNNVRGYQGSSTPAPKYEEVSVEPANVYKLEAPVARPEFSENRPANQHVLNQHLMDQVILNNQEKINQQREELAQNYNQQQRDELTYEQVRPQQQPQQHREELTNFNQQQIREELPATYHQPTRQPIREDLTNYNQPQQYGPQQEDYIKPLVHNRGQINQFVPTIEEQRFEPPATPKDVLPVISSLEDTSIRPLLDPSLLVPTTEQQIVKSTPKYTNDYIVEVVTTTTTTTTPAPETTTVRPRSRGRTRGGSARYTTPVSTTRKSNRRRPTRPTTTERVAASTEYISGENYGSTKQQRFRTRGRPLHNTITERVSETTSTTENEIKSARPVVLESFQQQEEPHSYMQFEHSIDNQKVIAIKPEEATGMKDYHQVFNVPAPQEDYAVQYENTATSKQPVVDIQITHPVTEATLITKPGPDAQYVRFNGNVQSGGVIYNNKNHDATTTTRSSVRIRGRTRGRSRFGTSTTTTTARPTTEKAAEENQSKEFYGFIRSPSFTQNKPAPEYHSQVKSTPQPLQIYSSSYHTTQRADSEAPVRFIGELRPKYQTTSEEVPPTKRGRTRVRVPGKSVNDVSGPGVSERVTSTTVRSRGRSHYRGAANVRKKHEEVIDKNLNYPASFFKSREATTAKPLFQITIAPNYEEEDQSPHASIHRPKFVANPDLNWTEATRSPGNFNDLPQEDKAPVALPVVMSTTEDLQIGTTEFEDFTTEVPVKKGRRRGVWKLVKHQPVDQFETAESQNYQSVINTFDSIEKVSNHQKSSEDVGTTTSGPTSTTTEEASILDSFYEMLGMNNESEDEQEEVKEDLTGTTTIPEFPEEITDSPTTNENVTDGDLFEATTEVTHSTFGVEPWEMKAVKTSTSSSTEISHETEICYKGRCVKSKNRKINKPISD